MASVSRDFNDIYEQTFSKSQQGLFAACAIKLLSSAALTAIQNLISQSVGSVTAEIISIDNQITLFDAEKNTLSEDGQTDPVKANIATLQQLTALVPNPFKDGRIDIPCLGSIPALFELVANIPNININNTAIANALIAAAQIIILQASKAALLSVLTRLLGDSKNISKALQGRANGTLPEPEIDYDREEIQDAFNSIADLSPEDSYDLEKYQEFINTSIVQPFLDGKEAQDAVKAQLNSKNSKDDDKIFDLVYGPPISRDGVFILSEDGLYYDSVKGGIPEVVAQQAAARNWTLDFDPNKGGKGIQVGDNINEFANTVFSDSFTETNTIVDYLYKNDKVIQAFIADKEKQINSVSGNIIDLIDQGYDLSSAMVNNYHQSINAISYNFDNKMRKRRKQLQLAGLFGGYSLTRSDFPLGQGYLINEGTIVDTNGIPIGWSILKDNVASYNDGNVAKIYDILDHVPVNDFTFFRGSGLIPNQDYQMNTLIHAADVEGIIKPLPPKIIRSSQGKTVFLSQFSVIDEPSTEFPYSVSSNVSSINATIKNLDNSIVMKDLVACYNFLKADIESPSSTAYRLDNKSSSYRFLDGKLVGVSATDIFPSGVGIAYLGGTLYNPTTLYSPEPWYTALGNKGYVRLKNNIKDGNLTPSTQKLDNLTYNDSGFSVDFWTYVPNLLTDITESHRYRLFMGCENTGRGRAEGSNAPITACPNLFDGKGGVTNIRDMSKVHGLIFGYRDKSNDGNIELCVLPTVSQNKEDGTFGDSVALAEIPANSYDPNSAHTELGFIIGDTETNSDGNTIGSVSSGFHHIVLNVDYKKDSITLFLDGKELSTSSVSTCFKLDPGKPLNVPSPASIGRSRYSKSLGVNNANRATESLHEGSFESPDVLIMTPWILGGGFTDTIPRSGKMESDSGFLTTPLGFLGSNTNDTYYDSTQDSSGGFKGQHTPGLGGSSYSGVNRQIPRSGLDGFLGSFKLYTRPLTTKEIISNYDAQKSFFTNISI